MEGADVRQAFFAQAAFRTRSHLTVNRCRNTWRLTR